MSVESLPEAISSWAFIGELFDSRIASALTGVARRLDLIIGNGDAASGEFVDMFDAGIVDPAKVTRSGLQNAASIAGMVLTTECIVVDQPEKDGAAAGAAGDGMGFDY